MAAVTAGERMRRQRSPDKQASIERRRRLVASGPLPMRITAISPHVNRAARGGAAAASGASPTSSASSNPTGRPKLLEHHLDLSLGRHIWRLAGLDVIRQHAGKHGLGCEQGLPRCIALLLGRKTQHCHHDQRDRRR
jgi:hypothetical protein